MRSGKSNICHLSSIAYRSCYDFWFILIPLQHFSDFQNKCGRWIAICFFPSDEGADKVRAGARCVPCLCDWKNQSRIRANPLFGQFTNRLESILTDPTLMTKLGDILESLIPCSTICSQSVICGSTSTLTGFPCQQITLRSLQSLSKKVCQNFLLCLGFVVSPSRSQYSRPCLISSVIALSRNNFIVKSFGQDKMAFNLLYKHLKWIGHKDFSRPNVYIISSSVLNIPRWHFVLC